MNEGEKRHISTNLNELVDKTSWRVSCKTVPIAKGVFGNEDVAELECIPNERKRIYKFYEIFMKKENSYQHLITTLEAGCQSGAVVILNKFDANLPVAGTSNKKVCIGVRFDVRQPVRLFTGRLKELADLHEKLQQSKSKATMISQMASIAGMGGIGKTELARMYIQVYGEDYDNNVIWISAETEDTLRESFQRLATDYLKISLKNVDGENKHMNSLVQEVFKFFGGKICLLVFDNAESNEDIIKFMPFEVPDPPYVLITSRDKHWQLGLEMVELNEMDELEAMELVKNGLQIEDDKQDHLVKELVTTLQCFPLAISQAISYIKQQQIIKAYNICEFLEDFKTWSEKLLSFEIPTAELNSYAKTTFTTWNMSIESLSTNKDCGEVAIRILNMIAYFQPDKIPTKLLIDGDAEKTRVESATKQGSRISTRLIKFFSFSKYGAKVKTNSGISSCPEKNKKAVELLVKYSMVNAQPKEETISIHRLVQKLTRIKNTLKKATLKNALRLLSTNFHPKTINHFCSVYKYCGAYDKLIVKFKYVPSRVMEELNKDEESGRYSGAVVGYELKETLQKHVSSEDDAVVTLERWIATANYKAGKYEIAAKIFEQILPTYIENKGGMSSKADILKVQYLLADCLGELGRRNESLKLLLEIHKSAKILYGINHSITMQVFVQIAECLHELGHFQKPFAENTDHDIQVSTQELTLPNPQEIISLLQAAYVDNKHFIGTDNNHSNNMFIIARFFNDIGETETARIIATDVYKKGRISNNTRVLIESMMCLHLLGDLNKKEGNFDEAHDYYKKAHALSSQTRGDNHPDTLLYKADMLNMLFID